MTNKKFTDEEIISSLQVIATTCNCNECKIRNCKWGTCNCSQTTANAALGLISRQQDEIDSLRTDLKRVCAERDAHMCTSNFIKSEAYKECAKKVNEVMSKAYDNNSAVLREHYKKHKDNLNYEFIGAITAKMNTLCGLGDFIDNLLKEMIGEEKE